MTTTTIPAIERQLDFRASPERLWRAITEDDELSAWFGQGAHLDLHGRRRTAGSSGRGTAGSRSASRSSSPSPGSRGAGATWAGRSTSGSTLVEFRLEPLAAGGTRLHLRESGFQLESSRWSNTEGWLSELARAGEPRRGRAVRGRDPADLRAHVADRAGLARVQRARGARAPGGPARPTSRSGRASRAGGCGRARVAGSGCGSRRSSRRATCAGHGRPSPRCRVAEPSRCCGPSGRSSRARTAARTSTCSRAASPGPKEFGPNERRLGRRRACRRSASTSARPDRRSITRARPALPRTRPGASAPLDAGARIPAPNSGSVLWGCVVSTGLGCLGTRAEVPSGLVKPAAKRSNCQQAACSRPRRLGRKVSMEAASPSRAVEASLSGGAARMRLRSPESSPI